MAFLRTHHHRSVHALLTTAAFLTVASCGDASHDEPRGAVAETADNVANTVEDWARDASHAGKQAADGATDVAKDGVASVGEGASSFGQMMSRAANDLHELTQDQIAHVGSWIDGPALAQRRQKCKQEGGTFADVVKVTACQEGKCDVTVDGDTQHQNCRGETQGIELDHQCVHTTWSGWYYFNDGPSVPHALQRIGSAVSDATDFVLWNSVFWEAAVNHDYCYHSGEATYGHTQEDCDGQFVDDLMALCTASPQADSDWFDEETCANNAHGMYAAVRACGAANFTAMNTNVKYPKYKPMYQKLGLREQPQKQELRDMIDGVL